MRAPPRARDRFLELIARGFRHRPSGRHRDRAPNRRMGVIIDGAIHIIDCVSAVPSLSSTSPSMALSSSSLQWSSPPSGHRA
eukprot:8198831-Pyramimonas_sp.AAC.1